MIVRIKNNTQDPIMVKDLSGVTILTSGYVELFGDDGIFPFYEVASSLDLKAKVTTGDLIVNDGTEDLSAANGLKHLEIKSVYEVLNQNQEVNGGTIVSATAPSNTNVLWINTNNYLTYVYDATREKWLSTDRRKFVYTFNGVATGAIYLATGIVLNSDIGVPIPRNGTITAVYAITDNSILGDSDSEYDIRCCLEDESIYQFALSNFYYKNVNVNVDVAEDHRIGVKLKFPDKSKDPVITVEVAWR